MMKVVLVEDVLRKRMLAEEVAGRITLLHGSQQCQMLVRVGMEFDSCGEFHGCFMIHYRLSSETGKERAGFYLSHLGTGLPSANSYELQVQNP